MKPKFQFLRTSILPTHIALSLGLAVAGITTQSAQANTADNVTNGQTNLTAAGTFSGGSPGTTNDVTFTNVTYSPAIFTLGTNGFNLGIGTLDDLSTTALTIQNGTASSTSTITLNGGTNSTSGAAAGDLLYVVSGGDLTIQNGSSGTLNLALAASGNFDIAGTAAISSIISGTGFGFTKTGTGTLKLSGANTFTGGTTISAGALAADNNSALGLGTVTLAGGTLQGTATNVTLTNNIVAQTSTTSVVGTNGNNLTLNGNISGSGNITRNQISGTSSVYLGGDNSGYSGTFTMTNNASAVVRFSSATAGSASAKWVFNQASNNTRTTLDFGTGTIKFGSFTGNGYLNTNSSGLKTVEVGALGLDETFSGQIIAGNNGGTLAVTKVGTGTWTLSGANGYGSGTTISNGTLQFAKTNSTPTTGAISVASGATIAVNAGGASEWTNGTSGVGTIGGLFSGLGGQGSSTVSFTSGAFVGIDTTNAGGSLTYAGNITNSGVGLTKLGTGTLVLTGANTYTGTTTVKAGTLALGDGTTDGTISNSSNITDNAALSYNIIGTQAYSGVISGTGSVTKTGAGTQTISGTNTYTGTTTVSNGTLIISGNNTATTGATSVTSTLQLQNAGAITNSALTLNNGSTLALHNNAGTTFSETSISIASGATVTFDVNNVSSGSGNTMALSQGITLADNASNVINVTGGNSDIMALGNVTMQSNSGGPYSLTINATTAAATTGTITEGAWGGVTTFTGSNSITVGGFYLNSNGNDGFTVNGANVTVTGSNTGARGNGTYTVTLTSGTLNLNNTGVLTNVGSGQTNTFTINGGTLDNTSGGAITQTGNPLINLNGDFSFGGTNALNLGTSGVTLGASRIITTNGTGALTFGGAISGATYGITKSGAGTLVLNGANSFSGGITLNTGTLTFGNNSALGSGTATLSGGTLKNGGSGYTLANNINVTSASVLDMAGNNTGLSGNISGSAALNLNNSGTPATLTLSGSNGGYSGIVTINNNNALSFSSANAGSANAAWVFNDATLDRVRINITGGGTINFGSISGSGQIQNDTASTTSTISVGALNTDTTFNGTMKDGTGILALTKVGTNKLTLSGTNTYTGATNVNNGTLVVNGSTATASAVTVSSVATLKGSGTVGGNTTISGTHAPGAVGTPGQQTFSGTLTYNSGSIFEWDLNAATTDPGANTSDSGTYGQVAATGAVSGTSAFKVVLGTNSFTDAFWDTNKTWTNIFTGAGVSTGTLASLFGTFDTSTGVDSTGHVAGQGYFTFNGSNTLTWTAVPEPTSALAGLLLGAGLLRRRRSA